MTDHIKGSVGVTEKSFGINFTTTKQNLICVYITMVMRAICMSIK